MYIYCCLYKGARTAEVSDVQTRGEGDGLAALNIRRIFVLKILLSVSLKCLVLIWTAYQCEKAFSLMKYL